MKKFFRLVSMFALAGATLTYTGCTDYDEDIDKINDRIDALETGKLKSLEDQVASLQTTVKSLEEAQKTASEALKTLENKHDADVKSLNTAINGVKGDITKINESLANYVTKTYADATFATKESVTGALTRIGNLESALENLPTNEAVKAAKDAAEAAQSDATKALGDIKALKEALGVYAEAGKLDAALKAKLDIAAFDAKFDEQLDKALAEDGKITTAIAEAIEAATAEMNTKIAVLQADVKDLANRIQSLVFVPEYNDGKASATVYSVKSAVLSENVAVKGTFKVTPEKLAPAVAKYALEDLVKVYAVTTATRAASADLAAASVEVTVAEDAAKTGRLEVSAVFAAKDIKEGDAIALYVNNPDSELTEGEKEDEKLDTKTYFSSAYVPVAFKTVDLADQFVFYNPVLEKEYEQEDAVSNPWDNYPGKVTFMAGYEPYVKIGEEYKTVAEAEEYYILPAGSLKVTVRRDNHYYDAKGNEMFGEKASVALKGTDNGKDGFAVEMVEEAAKDRIAHVDYSWKGITSFQVAGQFVMRFYTNAYKIARRTINITVASREVPWTLDNAEKLSEDHVNPYNKPIDEEFDSMFKELTVDMGDLDTVKDLNLGDILVPANMKPNHKLNGEAVEGVELDINAVAMIEANIAKVAVRNYKFAKGDGKKNVYDFCNTYSHEGSKTDINVLFTLTLGAIPGDVTVDLENHEFDYVKDYRPNFSAFTYYYGRNADNSGIDKATDPLYLAFNEMTAAEQAAFKNDAEYVDILGAVKTGSYAFTKNTVKVTDLKGYQFLMPNQSDLRSLVIPRSAVVAFSDKFEATTEKNLWFGQKVTFNGSASIKAPSYGLSLHKDLVKDGVATLNGINKDGTYVISLDDLSKYFNVENSDANAVGRLEVRYARVTEKTDEEGYENYPVIPAKADVVTEKGQLSNATIDWATYTARDLEVKASLFYDGIDLGVSENVVLTIKDPIVKFDATDIKPSRKPNEKVTVNLWSAMDIRGILNDKANMVNVKATDITNMWVKDANIYGAKVEFVDYIVLVGKDPVEVLPNKLAVDLEKGTVVYHEDAADLVQPITVKVTAKLTHVYNYNGKVEEADHIVKTFNVVISQK